MLKKQISPWWLAVVLILYVVNIRVEAGMATLAERTLDGLIGGCVFLVCLYWALRFFGVLEIKGD